MANQNGHTGGAATLNPPSAPNPSAESSTYNPAASEAVDIYRLLDELEELPEKAKQLPMKTLMGFDSERFYYLVLKIRANLPEDMKKAYRVARDTERIVDEAKDVAAQQLESGRLQSGELVDRARQEAARLVAEATAQAETLLNEHSIVRAAEAREQKILSEAEARAVDIRRGADEYAGQVLSNIESVLGNAIGSVQKGKEMLATMSA